MTTPGKSPGTEACQQLVEGESARESIDAAVAGFPDAISYVVASTGDIAPLAEKGAAAAEGLWFPCARLLADPTWLAMLIRASGRELGTDDPQVAASLFVQGYAYRILMVAVACLTTAGVIPDSAAARMVIGISKGRPRAVGYLQPAALLLDSPGTESGPSPATAEAAVDFLHDTAVEGHIAPLIAATRSVTRVGARLLWGNVASSAAVAFRTMDGCLSDSVRPLGELFFERAPSVLCGLGSFLALTEGERSGWFWERRNCCLYDRIPGNAPCADCSRLPTEKRRAGYRRSLEG